MKFFKLFLTVALSFSLTHCATNPVAFQEGKPLEAKGTFWTRDFRQDGKTLSHETVVNALKQFDSTNSDAKIAEAWEYSAIGAGALGGGFIGYYLFDTVDNGNTRGTGYLIGAALLGAGLLCAYFGDKTLLEGTQIYDNELKYKTSKSRFQPVFDLTSLGYGNANVPYLGLKFTGF